MNSTNEIPEKCPDCGASIFSIDEKEWRCEDQRSCCWTNKKQKPEEDEKIISKDSSSLKIAPEFELGNDNGSGPFYCEECGNRINGYTDLCNACYNKSEGQK